MVGVSWIRIRIIVVKASTLTTTPTVPAKHCFFWSAKTQAENRIETQNRTEFCTFKRTHRDCKNVLMCSATCHRRRRRHKNHISGAGALV